MAENRGSGALIVGGVGGVLLGSAVTALLTSRPAAAAPEDEKMDYLIDLQTTMVQQLQRLIEVGEALTMPEIVLPSYLTLRLEEAVITIPPDPEMLANAGQLKAEAGRMFIPTWRIALVCLSGVTTVLPINIPPGWVTYRRKPLEVSSDLYDPLIGLNVYSDNVLINPVAPMPITGPFTIDMGEYVTQWTTLTVEVINATLFNAVVSFQVCTYLMDASFWDEFIVPMIDAVQQKVEAIIK